MTFFIGPGGIFWRLSCSTTLCEITNTARLVIEGYSDRKVCDYLIRMYKEENLPDETKEIILLALGRMEQLNMQDKQFITDVMTKEVIPSGLLEAAMIALLKTTNGKTVVEGYTELDHAGFNRQAWEWRQAAVQALERYQLATQN